MTSKYKGVVGYIGLGDMGSGIAAHLAEVGVKLVVFDLNTAAIDNMVAKGARGAGSLEEVAASADVIVICVDPEAQVRNVLDGLVPHMRAGQAVIIQSSIPPQWLGEMAKQVATVGATLFDAPVSGSYEDRKNGTLSVLTGASENDVGQVKDLLESIGRPLYFDVLGGGEVAKLANNAIMMVTRLAVAETMAYARAWGLPEESLVKAVKISSGSCFVIDNLGYFDQHVRSGFGTKMAIKQSAEILDTAKARNVRLRMLEAALGFTGEIDGERQSYLLAKNQ
ncbi:NAD(P)-dependent oxidoreductase [Aquisediminimonas profunda]|uniref:NAD(P)-dependent oxidoreductase n=1 Tax=Aquisediminimonas profunda TaxID=1550733 RepID=UPI001C63904C|nr:NAD(P)-dependent oxidoreductase [Aquisediminimonas profunda]